MNSAASEYLISIKSTNPVPGEVTESAQPALMLTDSDTEITAICIAISSRDRRSENPRKITSVAELVVQRGVAATKCHLAR